MVRVKICGITNRADALSAVEAGADALGFNFHRPSPRSITVKAARSISRALPPMIVKVGVFVHESFLTIRRAFSECGLDFVQLHGEQTPEECARLGLPYIKALRVGRRRDLAGTGAWRRCGACLILLDSSVAGIHGGTGVSFDWTMLRGARIAVPFFLAGGLSSANVRRAVRIARPYGVDASTGVESRPGKKDAKKMELFVRAAKGAG